MSMSTSGNERGFCYAMLPKNLGIITSKGLQGWRSGASTRFPPLWPGFDSQTRHHMWVAVVGSLLCIEGFSPGTPVSPLFNLICINMC